MEAERSLQLLIGRNDVTTIVSTNASGGCLAAYLSIVFIAVYVVFFSFGFGIFFLSFEGFYKENFVSVAITETYLSNNKTYYKS